MYLRLSHGCKEYILTRVVFKAWKKVQGEYKLEGGSFEVIVYSSSISILLGLVLYIHGYYMDIKSIYLPESFSKLEKRSR